MGDRAPREHVRVGRFPLIVRVSNIMKHVCVAARIGDGKAPGEGNSYSYCQDEQRCHRRFWLQPFGLARVLACSPRLSAKGFCCWGGDGGRMADIYSEVYGTVPASGPGLRLTSHGAMLSKVPCLE